MDTLKDNDLPAAWSDPVRQLLLIGEPDGRTPAEWPDYPASFGLEEQHVDALIQMACDTRLRDAETYSDAVWGPLHAWRALGQLRAEGAVQSLLELLVTQDGDDWIDHEIPPVFGMIGPRAIPAIAGFVADRANPEMAVVNAVSGLTEIAERHPDCRPACIDILVKTLHAHPDSDPTINAFAVSALIDLHAVEAIDAIRAAYLRHDVDITIPGDLEDVEIDLGLRDKRATPKPHYGIGPGGWGPSQILSLIGAETYQSTRQPKIGRNEPCPCGSGKKYKKCCLK